MEQTDKRICLAITDDSDILSTFSGTLQPQKRGFQYRNKKLISFGHFFPDVQNEKEAVLDSLGAMVRPLQGDYVDNLKYLPVYKAATVVKIAKPKVQRFLSDNLEPADAGSSVSLYSILAESIKEAYNKDGTIIDLDRANEISKKIIINTASLSPRGYRGEIIKKFAGGGQEDWEFLTYRYPQENQDSVQDTQICNDILQAVHANLSVKLLFFFFLTF